MKTTSNSWFSAAVNVLGLFDWGEKFSFSIACLSTLFVILLVLSNSSSSIIAGSLFDIAYLAAFVSLVGLWITVVLHHYLGQKSNKAYKNLRTSLDKNVTTILQLQKYAAWSKSTFTKSITGRLTLYISSALIMIILLLAEIVQG